MEPQAQAARNPLAKGAVVIGGLALASGIVIAASGAPGFGTALVVAAIGDLALAGVFLAARAAWTNVRPRARQRNP